MGLKQYRLKRDFGRTPESAGTEDHSLQSRYVIQRHDARRLHYDLRLEMEGLLKSWGVPKGPSMNPVDKRLAVHTEDHPVKYLYFEGTIPKGNYGAGEMTIWDSGTFTSYKHPHKPEKLIEEYNKGALHLTFSGHKLKGKFTLIKTNYDKNNQWLLIKQKDEFVFEARYDAEDHPPLNVDEHEVSSSTTNNTKAERKNKVKEINIQQESHANLKNTNISLDSKVKPMLADSADEPFDDTTWLFELKYDGYRLLANIEEDKVRLNSRNGISYNEKFPQVHEELISLSHNAILDGEMIVVDQKGMPQFQALQNYDFTKGELQYMVFDLLYLNGHNTISLPLTERKDLLRDLLPEGKFVKYCDHIEEEGRSFYEETVDQGLEGIMAKKRLVVLP